MSYQYEGAVRGNIKQREARFLFDFELRGLKFNGAKEMVDGLELPEIMQVRVQPGGGSHAEHGFTNDPHNGADRYQSEMASRRLMRSGTCSTLRAEGAWCGSKPEKRQKTAPEHPARGAPDGEKRPFTLRPRPNAGMCAP
jgi:hypothetical protein